MPRLRDQLPERDKAHVHEDFLDNEESYWEVRESLLPRHRGKWVAVKAGQVLAESNDIFGILDQAEKLGGHPYITQVGFEDQPFVIRRTFPYDMSYQPFPLPRVTAKFIGQHEDQSVTFDDVILDTGADLSLLPERDGDAIRLRSLPYFTTTVRGIIGPSIMALVYRAKVEIAGRSCRSLVQLVESSERIIGRDVLNQLRVTFDGPAGQIEID